MSKLGKFLYKDDDISSKIGIGIIATDNPTSIPRELNNGSRYNVSYCFLSNDSKHDTTNYNPYVNNGKSSLTEYGSSLISGNEMTKNIYTKSSSENTTNDYNANSGIYGDAIYETSSNSSAPWNLAWYNDYSSFPSSFVPFFRRGGGYSDTTKAGVFYFGSSDGSDTEEGSFRPTLVVF